MSKSRAAAARPGRRPLVSESDARLWQMAMAGVKPLKRRPKPPAAPEAEAEIPGPVLESDAPPIQRTQTAVRSLTANLAPELAAGQAPGLDRRTAQRMRRGRMPVEARIDLHGLTQEEAHRALNAFLAASQAAGRRCVLVITGKGLREGGGVLRANVPHWLNQPPNRARLIAFFHAAPRDGGEGALYVLLRRAR